MSTERPPRYLIHCWMTVAVDEDDLRQLPEPADRVRDRVSCAVMDRLRDGPWSIQTFGARKVGRW